MLQLPFLRRRRSTADRERDALFEFAEEDGAAPSAPPAIDPRFRLALPAVLGLIVIVTTGAFAYNGLNQPQPPDGVLRVETGGVPVDVRIDGSPHGRTPLSLRLPSGRHEVDLERDGVHQRITVAVTDRGETVHHISWSSPAAVATPAPTTGGLTIVTDPAGAAVEVDGSARGVTPLSLTSLSAGEHAVVVSQHGVVRRRSVVVGAGTTASLVVALAPQPAASGWMTVSAAIPLQIFEGGALVGTSEAARIMLPAGSHDFELVSPLYGFKTTRTIAISPGDTSRVAVTLDKAPLSVNATPWADVWIDGVRAGETPMAAVMTTIGTHQVEFRHPDLGRKTLAVQVSLKQPARVSVDMRSK